MPGRSDLRNIKRKMFLMDGSIIPKDTVLGGVCVVDIHNPKAHEGGLEQLRLIRYYAVEQLCEFEF